VAGFTRDLMGSYAIAFGTAAFAIAGEFLLFTFLAGARAPSSAPG
jgi:hypothetical protein